MQRSEWRDFRKVKGEGVFFLKEFQVLYKVGQGSYGRVFKVLHLPTNKIYALKHVLHPEGIDPIISGTTGTTIREICLLRSIRHENLVALHHYIFEGPGRTYLLMEFLPANLLGYLRDQEMKIFENSLAKVKKLLAQMIRGLQELNKHGVIHRDLKCENILLDSHGNVKLADFGLARGYTAHPRRMTGLVQTFYYRAPEILLQSSYYSESVDMWSVGCLFAEIMLQRILFIEGINETGLLMEIFNLCGMPSPEEILQMYGKRGYNRLRTCFNGRFPQFQRKDFHEVFSFLPDSGIELMEGLLQVDPKVRLTTYEALESDFLQV